MWLLLLDHGSYSGREETMVVYDVKVITLPIQGYSLVSHEPVTEMSLCRRVD